MASLVWPAAGCVAALLLVSALTASATSAGDAPRPSLSNDPSGQADYVQIRSGKFELHGQPFVFRGVNYFGSWRFGHVFPAGDRIEHFTIWSLFQNWDADKAAADFALLRSALRTTAVRIGLPARDEFATLVQYHGYSPWYQEDGAVTDHYKSVLQELTDTAYAAGIRVQFCLLWNIKNEISHNPDDFVPGGTMDRFYENQVRSIGLALRDHPGAMAYSIGNEALVIWQVNALHRSSYEGRAAAFIARRLHDLREVAPRQLLATDEINDYDKSSWLFPGPDFAMVEDPAEGPQAHPFRLVDKVDYLGPHFYPEVVKPEDLPDDRFAPKLASAANKLADYMAVAQTTGKPVVLNEFGLKSQPETMAPAAYEKPRDAFYRVVAAAAQRDGLQGLLSWGALPGLALQPGDFTIAESHLNPSSRTEIDIRSSGERVLFYIPSWDLFVWGPNGDTPHPTPAAQTLAATWPQIPVPPLPNHP
jgi:hypothetical protein